MRALLAAAVLASVAGGLLVLLKPGASTDPSAGGRCDRYASPAGHDGARGTPARPVRSAQRLVGLLRRGQTGCLNGGTYHSPLLIIKTPGITLRPVRRTGRVKLKGTIRFDPSAAGSKLTGLVLDGRGGLSPHGPRIYADGVVLRNNEITNHHTSTCILVARLGSAPPPERVAIRRNRIHDCGRLPATNFDHGIYLASARHTQIIGNWIYDNADRGIQLYPHAQATKIVRNVIDRNGQGIIFSGSGSTISNDNLVSRNVIANARIRWNVESFYSGVVASGNRVVHNCVFSSNEDDEYNSHGGVQTPSVNFVARHNRVAKPAYVDRRSHNFRLRPRSACARTVGAR